MKEARFSFRISPTRKVLLRSDVGGHACNQGLGTLKVQLGLKNGVGT